MESQTPKPINPPVEFNRTYKAFDFTSKKVLSPQELETLGIAISPTGKIYQAGGLPPMSLKILFFSGMHSSKGLPLFEGDICKIGVKMHPDLPSLTEKWAVVRWIPQRTCFTLQIVSSQKDVAFEVREVELMGNEYENPQLLENLLK